MVIAVPLRPGRESKMSGWAGFRPPGMLISVPIPAHCRGPVHDDGLASIVHAWPAWHQISFAGLRPGAHGSDRWMLCEGPSSLNVDLVARPTNPRAASPFALVPISKCLAL